MKFAFDLISDLHLETWPNDIEWAGIATSPFCIVAGDVCRDHFVLKQFLETLSNEYTAVFYIDGNDEHRNFLDNIGKNYEEIQSIVEDIADVVYLQDNVVIIDGIAILGTNGWWDYGFDINMDIDQCVEWCAERYGIHRDTAEHFASLAHHDARYLQHSISRLQKHNDVKKIIIVTHTVPNSGLISFDPELAGTYRINTTGNSLITACLEEDTESKISIWCFGHYHNDIDSISRNIRWVNNPRGRGDTPWSKKVYFPKRIELEI